MRTYAVTWKEPGEPPHSGKLELGRGALALEGANGGGPVTLLVRYEELLEMGPAAARDRLDGRPTLVLERRDRGPLRLAGVAGSGIVSEILERLTALRG